MCVCMYIYIYNLLDDWMNPPITSYILLLLHCLRVKMLLLLFTINSVLQKHMLTF